jgi:magnesium transporter
MMAQPTPAPLDIDELDDAWPILSREERAEGFALLQGTDADEYFLGLSARDQAELLPYLSSAERRRWLRILPPDDAADLLQELDEEQRAAAIELLDPLTRRETTALLAYEEDEAGGLMSPRFARVRPDMTVDQAITYLRRQARRRLETIYYAYVLDAEQRLLGVISFRGLFASPDDALIREVMATDLVTVPVDMPQEEVARVFAEHDLLAVPVVDEQWRMRGIVTGDDVLDAVQEEATEDIQKAAGVNPLEAPYLDTPMLTMLRKRAGWLVVLFIGEMLTATAMARYEGDIKRAVLLATFVPLMISSGGNSGSQASTLIIRAMALDEVRLRDWWRVMRREIGTGFLLGVILAVVGFIRIAVWQSIGHAYGVHWVKVAFTVSLSLVGIVLWGSLSGSMLPMLLRRLGLDPASASAPFVATLVDVTGLILYFSIAQVVLQGALL